MYRINFGNDITAGFCDDAPSRRFKYEEDAIASAIDGIVGIVAHSPAIDNDDDFLDETFSIRVRRMRATGDVHVTCDDFVFVVERIDVDALLHATTLE